MNRYIFIKSDNNNHYYFNPSKKEILLLHPSLYKTLTSRKVNSHSKKQSYFEKKAAFLRENNYLETDSIHENYTGRIENTNMSKYRKRLSNIIFSVTDKCNLKCKYCTFGDLYCKRDSDSKNNESLDPKKAFTILNHFIKYWNSKNCPFINHSFTIGFYGGEPLLNFKLIKEIVEYCKSIKLSNNNKFEFMMTTNGLLLNKYIDFIVEHNFRLAISLDGNEENNSYRVLPNGKPSYNKVVSNVNHVLEKHPKYFSENINFYAVLHNKNSFLETYSYFKSNYNKEVEIYGLSTMGINPNFKATFNEMYKHSSLSLNEAIENSTVLKEEFVRIPEYSLISNVLSSYSLGFVKNYNELYRNEAKREYLPTGTCEPFVRKLFISTKGYLLPCEKSDHKYKMGEVTESKVVFYDEKIEKMYNEAYDKLKKLCKNCYSVDNCASCIFLMNYDNSSLKCDKFQSLNSFFDLIKRFINKIEEKPSLYSQIFNEYNYG